MSPAHDPALRLRSSERREQLPMLVLVLFCAGALLVLGWIVLREFRAADRWVQLPPPDHHDSEAP